MHHYSGVRRVAGALLISLLAACGDDGGSGDSMSTSIAPRKIDFTAASPEAAAPAAQTVTATFGSDIAHVSVAHTGRAIASVSSAVTGRTAQIQIRPNVPASVGAGVANGTLAVTGQVCADPACSSLVAVHTQTVAVTYQVSPIVRLVMPYIAAEESSGTAIVRGLGFRGFTVRGVKFGATPATASTVVSDTEIHATYPPLAAGTYEVQLDLSGHDGAVTSTAALVVIQPAAPPAATLSYPGASPAIQNILYDAQRSSLLVATTLNGGTLLRYAFANGAWSVPDSVAVSQLQDIALSTGGTPLLALSKTALQRIDPASLALSAAVAAPSLPTGTYLKNIAVANDNTAVITTGTGTSTATKLYAYAAGTATLGQISTALNNATPAASSDGSRVVLIQGNSATTSDLAITAYNASTSTFASAAIALKQTTVAPAVDRTATRIALNGVKVYGGDFDLLGTLPASTLAVAFRPDGKRAYTYDSAAAALLTFDTSADKNGAAFPRIGPAVPLAGNPGTGLRMTISPDGRTLFLAGNAQIAVQPTPEL